MYFCLAFLILRDRMKKKEKLGEKNTSLQRVLNEF